MKTDVERVCCAYNAVLLNQPEDQRDQTVAMRAALAAIPSADGLRDGWQPIETAPKQEDVLIYCPGARVPVVVAGLFDNGEEEGWSSDLREMEWLDRAPSHWRPLPAPPALEPHP